MKNKYEVTRLEVTAVTGVIVWYVVNNIYLNVEICRCSVAYDADYICHLLNHD